MSDFKHHQRRRHFLTRLCKAAGSVSLIGFATPLLAESRAAFLSSVISRTEGGETHLTLELTDAAEHSLLMLEGPDRIVVDLKQVQLLRGAQFNIDDAGPVKKLRYAPRNGNDFRIVLDVEQSLQASSQLVTTGSGSRQLVVTLRAASASKPASAAVAPRPQAAKPVAKNAPAQRGRDLIVAIDAGHGGKDPGAVGKNGLLEKDVVLSVARKLEALLKKEPGFRPVLTRDSDVFLPLRARVRKARDSKADLFVSIHADASPNREATGSSVYILSQNGASSEAARLLAEQENAVDLIGGVSLGDKDDTLAEVLLDLSQRNTLEASHSVAQQLLGELRRVGGVHSKNVEQAGFAVLKSPDIPSVLVETAFISNPREEKRLGTTEYQNQIAKSLLKGVRGYFVANAPQDSLLAMYRGTENSSHIIRSGETLSGIAHRYNLPPASIREANNLSTDAVNVGQVLTIPLLNT